MERDLSLFMEHTDKHIVEEVKKQHPAWVTKEGFCPKCVDHFKRAMHDPQSLTQDADLDASGVLKRAALGLVGFTAAALVFVWLESIQAPRRWRLLLFPLFFTGLFGYLQAKQKFCVVIAQKQAGASRRKARRILAVTAALSALFTAVSFIL